MRPVHTAIPIAAASALVLAAAGCTGVLGLEASVRDPCVLGGCEDATGVKGTSGPGVNDGPGDASASDTSLPSPKPGPEPGLDGAGAPDASTPDTTPPGTLRCGTTSYCDTGRDFCCAVYVDGGYDFACIPLAQGCPGIPITCAREADCNLNAVCCVTNSYQECTAGQCNGDFVCDPTASPSECPPGQSCVPFSNPNVPYYVCR